MASLHELFAANRDAIIARWKAKVEGSITPDSVTPAELADHVPSFLDDLIDAFRTGSSGEIPSSEAATTHGHQRLRLGFSLDAVVHEYGALCDVVVSTVHDLGATITLDEAQTVFNGTIDGIAAAVTEYVHQRDAELHRQHNEHVAFLAHELRNPLSSALMAIDLLHERPTESRLLHVLGQALERMHELIDHTLEIAQLVSRLEVRRERARIATLLEDAQRSAEIDAQAGNMDLVLHIDEDAELDVDVGLIRSALSNLVRNAIKYSHRGGVVELRGRVAADRAIFEIEDSCGGLAPGAMDGAFDPFVRKTKQQSGFGLGLAIVKQAIDAHGGVVRVENLPGKGCVFIVELPAVGGAFVEPVHVRGTDPHP
jgi:signal transduction histidine kinase